MCGILLALDRPVPAVKRGLEAMSYRGLPSCELGITSAAGWTLGHVRLPIQTDDTFGEQPFQDQDYTWAFAGEVFLDGDDERTLLEWAMKTPFMSGFHYLDGFWSIARISHRTCRAEVITDHLGIKPLYYWAKEGIVCSEIEPMFAVTEHRPPLDEAYLANCIKFGYDATGRTPWEGIVQVPPGTVLKLSPFGWLENDNPFRYWDWSSELLKTPADWDEILRESVVNRVQGILHPRDIRPGLLLSGGLDSTIVYTLARQAGLDFDIYSVDNGDDAEFLPRDANVHMLDAPFPNQEMTEDHAVRVMQAPLDLGSLYPQIRLAEVLAEVESRVVMTGDGADELFGGYRRAKIYDSQKSDVFCELPYYHLPRLDRVHMRYTTEVRSPYLAPRVVAGALKIPRGMRTEKQILKLVATKIGVDPRVINRPKLPLKSKAVIEGGDQHRINLVEAFRHAYSAA